MEIIKELRVTKEMAFRWLDEEEPQTKREKEAAKILEIVNKELGFLLDLVSDQQDLALLATAEALGDIYRLCQRSAAKKSEE